MKKGMGGLRRKIKTVEREPARDERRYKGSKRGMVEKKSLIFFETESQAKTVRHFDIIFLSKHRIAYSIQTTG